MFRCVLICAQVRNRAIKVKNTQIGNRELIFVQFSTGGVYINPE